MKTYIVEKDIHEWLHDHKDILFDDILEACESSLQNGDYKVTVASIRTTYGITLFNLPSPIEIVESLKKCEDNYVMKEEYEKAARARDCGRSWEDRIMIYKEKDILNELY